MSASHTSRSARCLAAAARTLLCVAASTPVVAQGIGGSADSARTAADVRAAVERFAAAYAAADTATLAQLLAPAYVHTNFSGSVVDRTSWLAWVAGRRREIDRGDLAIEEYRNTAVRIDLYGPTAVVTGIVASRIRRFTETQQSRYRFTHVWVRMGERWQRAAFQDAQLPPS